MTSDYRFGCYEIQTECSHCGNPLILNGPARDPLCLHCLKRVELSQEVWKSLVAEVDDTFDQLKDRQGQEGKMFTGGFAFTYGWYRLAPRCASCREPLPADAVSPGTDGTVACPACHASFSTFPVPAWLREKVPTAAQVFCADRENEPSALDTAVEVKPVMMQCPGCAGTLNITKDNDRVTTCPFCAGEIYLPDALWQRLHPVKTVREWFIGFTGENHRCTQRAAKKKKAEARKRSKEEKARAKAKRDQERVEQRRAAKEQAHLDGQRRYQSALRTTLPLRLLAVGAGAFLVLVAMLHTFRGVDLWKGSIITNPLLIVPVIVFALSLFTLVTLLSAGIAAANEGDGPDTDFFYIAMIPFYGAIYLLLGAAAAFDDRARFKRRGLLGPLHRWGLGALLLYQLGLFSVLANNWLAKHF